MARRNRNQNARRNAAPARPASAAAKAAPGKSNVVPFPTEAEQRASLVRALLDAPHDTRTPSMQLAERYRIEPKAYTVREQAASAHALDFNGTSMNALSFVENTGFPGFPTLSLLGQLPEYRSMHERLADECIRMWGTVASSGESNDDVIQAIEAELKRIDLPAVIREAVIHDQAFGGAHVFFKFKEDKGKKNLPLVLKHYTVPKGSFVGLRVVEPYWVTPNDYNSIDPTEADFYEPNSWWMIGTEVHATRLQTLISRPVADMLKPSYSFRGISMTQLAMPYVDNWLRTRQSVSDTLKQFSVSGVRTDLQQALLPGAGASLANRAELINRYRDNRNILFLDKATEEFFQVNTPLSGLDALQAQSQEQMSAVCHIPLVVLLGITPTGLNASSEGELRAFYDYVKGYQKNVLTSLVMNVLRVVQLSLFGQIDPGICWEWTPLYQLTELEAADVRAKDADTDAKYIENGVIRPDQVTKRLANDPNSGYAGIDGESLEDIPDDNIQAITDKIMEVGQGDPVPAAPVPAEAPVPAVGMPAGALPSVAFADEATAAEGLPGAHASDPSQTDDPGVLKV